MKTFNESAKEAMINIVAITGLYFILLLLIRIGVIDAYYKGILILIGINIIAASSLNLATGYLGQLALGHAGFMAIGAYTMAIFLKGAGKAMMGNGFTEIIALVIGLIFGGIIAAAAGVFIGIPALRLRGDYLGIVTLGFGEITRITINNMKITRGALGINGIPKLLGFTQIFILAVVVLAILYLLIRSRHGRAILSIREDEIAAEAVGVPTTFYKVFGFSVSAFFAGIAGGALATYQSSIKPDKFSFMFSVEIFIIVVLGGMGSLTGTIAAAVFIGVLNEALRFMDELRLVVYAALLIIMMILRPNGILGTREFSFVKLLKKVFGKKSDESAVKGGAR